MRIDSPQVSNLTFQEGAAVADSSFTGSFSGSFTGVGNFTGLTADNVEYANVLNKPTLISSSAQIASDISGSSDGKQDILSEGAFVDGDKTKLDAIEASADVTDTENVTAAGALMDSEVTNLADVKSFDPADYATAAQGTTADSAQQPPSEGAFVNGDKTKLDGIEASADVTDTANVKSSLNASLGGSATIGDSSDTITIPGNLTVQGTQTTLDTATLNVADLNILVASGAADAAAANGGGLTVDGASATLTYASTGDKWVFNKVVDVPTSGLLIDGTVVTSTAAELNQLDGNTVGGTTAGDIVTINGTQTLTNKTIAASQVTEISNLTAAEGEQLENIDTTTISATQWGYLGASNQGITTTSDVQFNDAQVDSLGIGTAASGTTGEIRATGDITAFYSSDERLKENFTPLTGALDKVKAIGGYEFDWKDGIEEIVSKKGHDIGVKAQELQAQYPELVHERDNGYLAVDYIKLNAVLIEAVKELAAKVEELSK